MEPAFFFRSIRRQLSSFVERELASGDQSISTFSEKRIENSSKTHFILKVEYSRGSNTEHIRISDGPSMEWGYMSSNPGEDGRDSNPCRSQ